ncbi:MAG: hypothetical protein M1837_006550 [Sclerophora amabilis]|nr:MAG: hypothetical protein M1837_006550 [Sclerophora amabilis]
MEDSYLQRLFCLLGFIVIGANSLTPPLIVQGAVYNNDTNYPLSGLLVRAFFLEPHRTVANTSDTIYPNETLIGSSYTVSNGTFNLEWIDNPATSERLFLLANYEDARFQLRVFDGNGSDPLVSSPALTGKDTTVNLSTKLPAVNITTDDWKDMGERFKARHLETASDLVQQLVFNAPETSIFKDWPIAKRQTAVKDLESAMLDPTNALQEVEALPSWSNLTTTDGLKRYQERLGGTLTSNEAVSSAFAEMTDKLTIFQGGLGTASWKIDPNELVVGPAAALTKYSANYTLGRGIFDTIGPIRPRNAQIDYRDYLREIWTKVAPRLREFANRPGMTEDQAVEQLQNRFHQNFLTEDTKSTSVNEILIPIMTEILRAPTESMYGFGLDAGAIPDRDSQTAREYLDTLIALTKLSAKELALRYRTDFSRPDSVMSDPVWENIYTLQGFFRDSFQTAPDPWDIEPDVLHSPLINENMQDKAPFFLQYDEWLLQRQPLSYENYYQIRQIFHFGEGGDTGVALENERAQPPPTSPGSQYSTKDLYDWYDAAFKAQAGLNKGFSKIAKNEYKSALITLTEVLHQVNTLLQYSSGKFSSEWNTEVVAQFRARSAMKVNSMDDLNTLMTTWNIPAFLYYPYRSIIRQRFGDWAEEHRLDLVCSLVHLRLVALPTVLGQLALATGDYATAVSHIGKTFGFKVGVSTLELKTGWPSPSRSPDDPWTFFSLYSEGDLPYTVQSEGYGDLEQYLYSFSEPNDRLNPIYLHRIENRYLRLQLGHALLEWADSLYRTDEDGNIARARELYKGVLIVHEQDPGLTPSWISRPFSFIPGYINPMKAAQLSRAQLGLAQIKAGLNFFGFSDESVPMLRYPVLKTAADSLASGAKATENDFINSMAQLESLTIEGMKNSALLARTDLQSKISQEEIVAAKFQVGQVEQLVKDVKAQIERKRQEIEDHDGFWNQLKDYASGMVETLSGMSKDITGPAKEGLMVEAGMSTQETSGLLGLGAGSGALAGFGAFYYASYVTMSGMADAANARAAELDSLEKRSLPQAQKQLELAKGGVTIAELNHKIVQNEATLAKELLSFADERFLNSEFWVTMANLFKRSLRQYLNMGTRTAWLAERALAYEQNAIVAIIRMDYFPIERQGVGGADQLLLDLANLETKRLDGLKDQVPIKHTMSLARDLPLQMAQLRTTGRTVFATSELPLQYAYPGVWGSRIVAVDVALPRSGTSSPLRGLLSQLGVSQVSDNEGTLRPLVRPASALPISDFSLASGTDITLYGLPGATLMPFEGNGMSALWKLEFPAAGNPGGLRDLADVLVTFSARGFYSPLLHVKHLAEAPKEISRSVVFSGGKSGVKGLALLQDPKNTSPTITLSFDLTTLFRPFSPLESKRTLNNLIILLVPKDESARTVPLKATVKAHQPSEQSIPVEFDKDSLAVFSNNPPIEDMPPPATEPASPLNVLKGAPLTQTIEVEISRSQNNDFDLTSIRDVLLQVDYTAELA